MLNMKDSDFLLSSWTVNECYIPISVGAGDINNMTKVDMYGTSGLTLTPKFFGVNVDIPIVDFCSSRPNT